MRRMETCMEGRSRVQTGEEWSWNCQVTCMTFSFDEGVLVGL